MPPRDVSRGNPEQLHWDDQLVEQGHQPAHRAHEDLTALAPVHILGPVKTGDFFWQSFCEYLGGGTTFTSDRGAYIFSFCSRYPSNLADIEADFLRKGVRGGSRLSIFECYLGGRSRDLFGNIPLRREDAP